MESCLISPSLMIATKAVRLDLSESGTDETKMRVEPEGLKYFCFPWCLYLAGLEQ